MLNIYLKPLTLILHGRPETFCRGARFVKFMEFGTMTIEGAQAPVCAKCPELENVSYSVLTTEASFEGAGGRPPQGKRKKKEKRKKRKKEKKRKNKEGNYELRQITTYKVLFFPIFQ